MAGLSYGMTDGGALQLALWCVSGADARASRAALATVSAGFTLGAFITPLVIAAALRAGSSCYAAFVALGLLAALSALLFVLVQPLPVGDAGGSDDGVSRKKQELDSDRELEELIDGRVTGKQRRKDEPSRPSERWRVLLVTGSLAMVLFCVTGVEHAVATWLPIFGGHVGAVDPQTMALITSIFWGTIAAGRVCWSLLALRLPSAWPILFIDALLMLGGAVLFISFSADGTEHPIWLLWMGSIGIGVGIASAFPCTVTLPAEASVANTPTVMMAFNLLGSAGEMVGPFVLGCCFDIGWYASLGWWSALLPVLILCATFTAWANRDRRL